MIRLSHLALEIERQTRRNKCSLSTEKSGVTKRVKEVEEEEQKKKSGENLKMSIIKT